MIFVLRMWMRKCVWWWGLKSGNNWKKSEVFIDIVHFGNQIYLKSYSKVEDEFNSDIVFYCVHKGQTSYMLINLLACCDWPQWRLLVYSRFDTSSCPIYVNMFGNFQINRKHIIFLRTSLMDHETYMML